MQRVSVVGNSGSGKSHQNIIRWAWTNHDKYQRRYGDALVDERFAHLQWVRLHARADAAHYLTTVHRRC